MKKQHIIAITTSCIILLGMITILYLPNKVSSGFHTKQPTLFVHGYKGTANSFDFMLDRFENEYHWGRKALVYYVASSGKIHVHNVNEGQGDPAFVQVIFENNRASLEDQSKWLAGVMTHLRKNYHVDNVNIVAHSMGGLVSVKYLESYQGSQRPSVGKLVTIGSPFAGIFAEEYFKINRDAAATDLKPDSAALKLLHENDFPGEINVLSIGSAGDAIAVPESVQALRRIVPADRLQETMINNEDLGHSGLHEDKAVDRLIYSFLWKDTKE